MCADFAEYLGFLRPIFCKGPVRGGTKNKFAREIHRRNWNKKVKSKWGKKPNFWPGILLQLKYTKWMVKPEYNIKKGDKDR